MLYWAAVFFIIALVSALFGFGGVAGTAAGIAKMFFYLAVIVFAVTLLAGIAMGRRLKP